MPISLPKIYPITDVGLSKLSHREQVERLAAGGAEWIQLREKYASPKDFYESAKEVLEFARHRKLRIIINDRVDIALAVKADGVHLGQDDLPPERARRILGKRAIIGFSTHSIAQAVAAVAGQPIDYVAVGPIFPTRTKENPDRVVGLETLQEVRRAIGSFPLVSIGGIDLETIRAVLQNGADSAAVISGVLTPPEQITENIRQFNRILC
jgi:thiamine-phosphate pyrophosphorylase